MSDSSYPDTWPRADGSLFTASGRAKQANSVVERMTEEMRVALWTRKITTRDLAKQLGVSEVYLSHLFPGKQEPSRKAKKELLEARKAFRSDLAAQVLRGETTIPKAAEAARVRYDVMYYWVRKLAAEQASKEATE